MAAEKFQALFVLRTDSGEVPDLPDVERLIIDQMSGLLLDDQTGLRCMTVCVDYYEDLFDLIGPEGRT